MNSEPPPSFDSRRPPPADRSTSHPPAPAAASPAVGARRPLFIVSGATLAAAIVSRVLPEEHAATGVGLLFLALAYVLVFRHGTAQSIHAAGLSLGGLFEPEPLDARRVAGALLRSALWTFGAAVVVFPPFWLGFVLWYSPADAFSAAPAPSLEDVLGQIFGIAFPEEVFYRGYAQGALDRAWPPRLRVLGAKLGPGLVVSSALFAVGHLLTDAHPARLAVFFPSLLFGFLRARTGGVGASIAFHALCNLFSAYLAQSYGLR